MKCKRVTNGLTIVLVIHQVLQVQCVVSSCHQFLLCHTNPPVTLTIYFHSIGSNFLITCSCFKILKLKKNSWKLWNFLKQVSTAIIDSFIFISRHEHSAICRIIEPVTKVSYTEQKALCFELVFLEYPMSSSGLSSFSQPTSFEFPGERTIRTN